jgi:hypothetical protein
VRPSAPLPCAPQTGRQRHGWPNPVEDFTRGHVRSRHQLGSVGRASRHCTLGSVPGAAAVAGVRDVAKAGTAIHFGEGLSICSGCSNRLRRSFRHATHVVMRSRQFTARGGARTGAVSLEAAEGAHLRWYCMRGVRGGVRGRVFMMGSASLHGDPTTPLAGFCFRRYTLGQGLGRESPGMRGCCAVEWTGQAGEMRQSRKRLRPPCIFVRLRGVAICEWD